eukprot:826405-Pyramimonas_sp.AAC.1
MCTSYARQPEITLGAGQGATETVASDMCVHRLGIRHRGDRATVHANYTRRNSRGGRRGGEG